MAASTDAVQISFVENAAEKELRTKKLADVRRYAATPTHMASRVRRLVQPLPAASASVP